MLENMGKRKTAEEIRRLKARGLFDVGTFYLPHGLNKVPKHRYWDRADEETQR